MNARQPPLLEIGNLTVRYGLAEAVRGISFEIAAAEVVTILGPNGAGKTTTLEAIMGLLAFVGNVAYQGRSLSGLSIAERVRSGLALVPESRDLFADMTVRENLLLGAYSRHIAGDRSYPSDLARVFDVFPRLSERHGQLAGTLSGGERQMLAIGRALMLRPAMLLLDEPSLGLAPLIVGEIFGVINRLKAEGVSILLVEQNARAALQVADRACVLDTGIIVRSGTAKSMAEQSDLAELYLGRTASE